MRVVQPPPGPMPDLDAVGAALEQEPRALGGRDVAGDHLDVAEALAELAHRPFHDDRVAVRDVDDEDVDAGADELGGALQVVAGGADRRADAQPALLVARGKRQPPLVHEVARGDEPEQTAVVVDERQLLDLALDHDALGFGRARAGRDAPRADRAASCGRRRAPSRSFTNRTSRSVSRPFSRRLASTTTSVPTRERAMSAVASPTDADSSML